MKDQVVRVDIVVDKKKNKLWRESKSRNDRVKKGTPTPYERDLGVYLPRKNGENRRKFIMNKVGYKVLVDGFHPWV